MGVEISEFEAVFLPTWTAPASASWPFRWSYICWGHPSSHIHTVAPEVQERLNTHTRHTAIVMRVMREEVDGSTTEAESRNL